ncbi:hypothetical protein LIER_40658 [Lithospermum erythrorhizon]|uniref:Retrotransposon Copia-like N-terminal domain-containing protein n=1 Tax=Lithospermum erythrorhizon TaxID=34254 RepID=A0AAV3QXV8_LITER
MSHLPLDAETTFSGDGTTEPNDDEILYRKIDPSSPYYLGSNDNPGNMISTVKLHVTNYEQWARSMRLSPRGRRNIGFIDGTICKPTNPVHLCDWDAVQSTLVQWIMNTIDDSQKAMISYFEEAKPLRDLLQKRFTVSNGQRKHELKQQLSACKQTSTMTVATYFGKLEMLWDELDKYSPVPACVCGMSEEFLKQRDEEKFHDFFHLGSITNNLGIFVLSC